MGPHSSNNGSEVSRVYAYDTHPRKCGLYPIDGNLVTAYSVETYGKTT